ncbi:MAG: hypothetical protein OXI50_11245 [Gammaproteobacteria bacterium]|nr:hypothetical protein [Gammaproteobacteria bacterium]MYC99165.1 hypothetical protein [Gammaproteobacteria bacterium]
MSKQPQDLLMDLRNRVNKRDNNPSRHERLEHLTFLRNRIDAWIEALEVPAKSLGPSQEEMDCILTDLEGLLRDLRGLHVTGF